MKVRGGETGWNLVAMHDPAGRRGLWYRAKDGNVELCAGREGDDAYVLLPGQLVGGDLENVLSYALYAYELGKPDEPQGVR